MKCFSGARRPARTSPTIVERIVLAEETHVAGRLPVVVLQPPHEPGGHLGQYVDRPECPVEPAVSAESSGWWSRPMFDCAPGGAVHAATMAHMAIRGRRRCDPFGAYDSTHGPTPLMRPIFTRTTTLVGESRIANGWRWRPRYFFANRSISSGSGPGSIRARPRTTR